MNVAIEVLQTDFGIATLFLAKLTWERVKLIERGRGNPWGMLTSPSILFLNVFAICEWGRGRTAVLRFPLGKDTFHAFCRLFPHLPQIFRLFPVPSVYLLLPHFYICKFLKISLHFIFFCQHLKAFWSDGCFQNSDAIFLWSVRK